MNPRTFSVAQRIFAAAVFGYLLAVLVGILLSCVLPMPRFEAVTLGLLASFPAYAAAIMWAFAARALWSMWLGMLVPLAGAGGTLLVIRSL